MFYWFYWFYWYFTGSTGGRYAPPAPAGSGFGGAPAPRGRTRRPASPAESCTCTLPCCPSYLRTGNNSPIRRAIRADSTRAVWLGNDPSGKGNKGPTRGMTWGIHGPKNNHPVRRTIDEGKTSVRIVARVLATMYAGKERDPQRADG